MSKASPLLSDKGDASSISEIDIESLLPYLRVAKYRKSGEFQETLAEAANLAPDKLSPLLNRLKKKRDAINNRISDNSITKRTYNSLCFALLRIILSIDKYKITYIDPVQFEDNVFGLILQKMNRIRPVEVPEGIAFVAQNNDRKLLFCFDNQGPALLREIATSVKDADKGNFNNICVMIVRDMATMKDRRRFSRADEWPGGFFACFEELQRKAALLNSEEYSRLRVRAPLSESPGRTPIMSVSAEVKENIPVGENRSHYKLRFKTDHGFNIVPGQFVMMATAPEDTISEGPVTWDIMKEKPSWIEPRPYLKRPFGIHRAFYRHFSEDKSYLRKLSLPPQLATVLHTVFPNKFEILYKVLTNGIGTRELSRLKKGNRIQILGPLGNGQMLREIRDNGFDEIHVIGGGVGMAPLIFIVQALRYYSYNVKAFVGTEKIGMLKYKRDPDGLNQTFGEDDPTIYIDDLFETGIDRADIYVSSSESEIIFKKVPEENLYRGLVSDQYKNYLLHTKSTGKILVFACGPFGMMKALAPITKKYKIPLRVLMEKRMACGIGVCLSCVCETKKAGEATSRYSRVCTDGPIFDADEIIWERIH